MVNRMAVVAPMRCSKCSQFNSCIHKLFALARIPNSKQSIQSSYMEYFEQ